jgi:hypothetical protein
MRKHRVLDRVLLIYDELIWRLSANEDFDPAVISDSAKLVQNFIENYHEKSEEDLPVFSQGAPASQPRHNATRAASGWPQGNAQYSRICGAVRSEAAANRNCISAMGHSSRLYRPPAARENTCGVSEAPRHRLRP